MDSLLSFLQKHRTRIFLFLGFWLLCSGGFLLLSPLLLADMAGVLGLPLYQTVVGEALAARLLLSLVPGLLVSVFLAAFLWLGKPLAVLTALLLFAGGLLFGRFLLLPNTLKMLTGLLPDGFGLHISVWSCTGFWVLFELLLGLIFEEPVIVLLLYRLRIVTGKALREKRKGVYLAVLILLAILTPTQDALTLLVSMVPVVGLYELSAAFLILLERRKEKDDG